MLSDEGATSKSFSIKSEKNTEGSELDKNAFIHVSQDLTIVLTDTTLVPNVCESKYLYVKNNIWNIPLIREFKYILN